MVKDKKEIILDYMINLAKGIENIVFYDMYINMPHRPIKRPEPFFSVRTFQMPKNDEESNRQIEAILAHTVKQIKKKKIKMESIPYNLSLIMFVTAFETLLYDMFVHLVDNDKSIKKKFCEDEKKVKSEFLEKYKNNEISLADIIIDTKKYNFQNLNSANDAIRFATRNKIDLFNILNKFSHKKLNAVKEIQNTIELRHKIIHEAYNDNSLDKHKIEEIYAVFFNIGLLVFSTIMIEK